MKLEKPRTVLEIARIIGGKVLGNPDHLVSGLNEIHRVEPGDLTFVDVEKYFKKSFNSQATTILLNKQVSVPEGKALILSDDPFRDYNILTEYFQPRFWLDAYSSPILGENVRIGKNVVFGNNTRVGSNTEISHNVVIGSNVSIGANTLIYGNVTIHDNCVIGSNCCIQAGAVIGGEAFYFKKRSYGRDKMLTKGRVILEDWVEIGANTTIDRGVSADTSIGEHTKIDNLVQIGHDTTIGKRCVIAAQVGIAGVSSIGDDVILWGQVGIPSDIHVGNGAVIMAKSGVLSSLEGGKTYWGIPAKDFRKGWREIACIERLPELIRKIEEQEK